MADVETMNLFGGSARSEEQVESGGGNFQTFHTKEDLFYGKHKNSILGDKALATLAWELDALSFYRRKGCTLKLGSCVAGYNLCRKPNYREAYWYVDGMDEDDHFWAEHKLEVPFGSATKIGEHIGVCVNTSDLCIGGVESDRRFHYWISRLDNVFRKALMFYKHNKKLYDKYTALGKTEKASVYKQRLERLMKAVNLDFEKLDRLKYTKSHIQHEFLEGQEALDFADKMSVEDNNGTKVLRRKYFRPESLDIILNLDSKHVRKVRQKDKAVLESSKALGLDLLSGANSEFWVECIQNLPMTSVHRAKHCFFIGLSEDEMINAIALVNAYLIYKVDRVFTLMLLEEGTISRDSFEYFTLWDGKGEAKYDKDMLLKELHKMTEGKHGWFLAESLRDLYFM